MSHSAGRDVSLEETAICVVDGTGRIVTEMRASSEPEALVAALREMGLAFERIGLEACSLTAWLHDALRSAVQVEAALLRSDTAAPSTELCGQVRGDM